MIAVEIADRIWALREGTRFTGFMPHTHTASEFAKSLEREGLLHRSETGPFWEVTPKGRLELARLEAIL